MSVQLAVETRRLAAALRSLGIPAEFNSHNDILADGKKVSGAAGYGCGNCYLYHASLLWEADLSAIDALLTVNEAKLKRHGIRSVRQSFPILRMVVCRVFRTASDGARGRLSAPPADARGGAVGEPV